MNNKSKISDINRLFDDLMPVRKEVHTIDPEITAILTSRYCMNEEFDSLLSRYSHLPKLPNFVVIDMENEDLDRYHNQMEQRNVCIVSYRDRDSIPQRDYCLFFKQDPKIWTKNGLMDMHVRVTKERLTHYSIDAHCIKFLHRRSRIEKFFTKNINKIMFIYDALADGESRNVYLRAIKMIETGDPGYMPVAAYPQYFHPEVKAQEGDVIYEGGVFDGMTTLKFRNAIGATGMIYGFEPVRASAVKARAAVSAFSNVVIDNLGLWSQDHTFYIENKGGGSRMAKNPLKDAEKCHAVSIDKYIGDKQEKCDMIKLDVEGAEVEVLNGAYSTIAKYVPKLQLSLYHKPQHYIDIPYWVIKKNLGYSLFVGHHRPWIYETMLYGIKRGAR